MRKKLFLNFFLFVIALSFAYLVMLQFKPVKGGAYFMPPQNVELVELIKNLEGENQSVSKRIIELREQIEKFEKTSSLKNEEIALISSKLKLARENIGLTEIKGSGIEIILSDSIKKPTLTDDPYYFVIHDSYLRNVVNLLKYYNATSISINDQRILVNSSITCAGPIILVNSAKLAPPYVIKAIGDPEILSKITKETFFEILFFYQKQFSIIVKVEKKQELTIPAYLGSVIFKYAKEIKP